MVLVDFSRVEGMILAYIADRFMWEWVRETFGGAVGNPFPTISVTGRKGEVVPKVGLLRHQKEDRLFPLIKGGFRGLSFFLVDRHLQPPWSPFTKGEKTTQPSRFRRNQTCGTTSGFLTPPRGWGIDKKRARVFRPLLTLSQQRLSCEIRKRTCSSAADHH
jgi:hypothetical protein